MGNFKIKSSSIVISMTCALLVITSPYIGQRYNNILKLFLECVILASLLSQGVNKRKIKYIGFSILYLFVTALSTYFFHGLGSRFLNSIVTAGAYVCFFYTFSLYAYKYSFDYVFDVVKKNIVAYMLILDFFVLVTLGQGLGGRSIGEEAIEEAVYLLGNKFMTSYLHMMVMTFIPFSKKRNITRQKRVFRVLLFLVYSIIICLLTDTTTGIVGCLVVSILMILFIYRKKFITLITNPKSLIVFFLGINGIFLLTDVILNNTNLASFLLSRSHTNTILSGRLTMYKICMDAIAKNPIWGYGLNYDIVQTTLSFGNPQNGILKMLLDSGIVGTVVFVFLLYNSVPSNKQLFNERQFAIIAFIYAMLFCSLVEINISAIFMLGCALLNSSKNTTINQGEANAKKKFKRSLA